MSSGNDAVTLKTVLAFIKLKFGKIALRAGVSFGIVALAIILLYALLPRDTTQYRDIVILLPQVDNVPQYPSGKAFSPNDIISPLVLESVYKSNEMDKQIPFPKFCALFSIYSSDVKQSKLDAEYRDKMRRKNITVVELQELERSYRNELQKVSVSSLRLTMNPPSGFSRMKITKILTDVPETWYRIYSKLEAKEFPQIETAIHLQNLRKQISRNGYLILLEKTRRYCRQVLNVCSTLDDMLQGQNVSLPTGEYLGDIHKELESIMRYQLDVLRQYILLTPQVQGTFDKIYLHSALQTVEQDLARLNIRYNSALEALNALQSNLGNSGPAKNGISTTRNSPSANTGLITLQLDKSFFNQFADMIRNDVNNTLRAKYAEKAIEYGDKRANLEADRMYYEQLLKGISAQKQDALKISVITPQSFHTMLQNMYTELFATSAKVIQLRDLLIEKYLTSRTFYVPVGPVQVLQEYRYSFKRLALALLALWALYNLCATAFNFYRMNDKAPQKEDAA